MGAAQMVIDVDTSRPWDVPDPRSWRGRHPIPTIVLLTLCVLAVLTGPILLRTPTLTLAWQVGASTRFFWLTPDSVYSLDRVDAATVALAAHEPGNQHIIWSLRLTGPLAGAYATANPLFAGDLPPSSDGGVRTTIALQDSKLIYPAAAVPLVYLTDRLIITIDRDPTVDPLPGSGATNNGLEWTHVVTVRDLATRRVLWTRRLPPGVRWALPGVTSGTAGIVGLPTGADWLATYAVGGTVAVWDLGTGATRASLTVDPLTGKAFVTALPDTVVVSHPQPDGSSALIGYDPGTLIPVWRLRPPLNEAEPISCQPDLCLVSHRATWFVDPRTGRVTAQIQGTEVRPGPAGQAVVAPYGKDTAVVSTDTGLDRPVAGVWRLVDATSYEPLAVVAEVHPLGRADLGLLDPLRNTVAVLGRTDQWSDYYTCLAVDTTLACDDGSRLSVWRRGSSL